MQALLHGREILGRRPIHRYPEVGPRAGSGALCSAHGFHTLRVSSAPASGGPSSPLGAGQLYELARLHALGGQERQALQAFERAVDSGFRDVEALIGEPDLERIRRSPGFAALVERARAAPKLD